MLPKWHSFRYWVYRIISLRIEPFPLKPMSCSTMYVIWRPEPAIKFKHLPYLITENRWHTLVAILQQVSPYFFMPHDKIHPIEYTSNSQSIKMVFINNKAKNKRLTDIIIILLITGNNGFFEQFWSNQFILFDKWILHDFFFCH